jgi:hypothetical protein
VLRPLAVLLSALLVPLAAGCGGADERSPAAEQIAALCDGARADIEALGLPSETGPGVITPWANRGTRLANEIRAVEGADEPETQAITALATALDEYYAGLRLGYVIYTQTKSSEAYAQTIDRADAFLEDADAEATKLGAPECTVRPFGD